MTPFSERQQIRQHLHGDGSRRDGHGLPAPAERRSPARGSPDPPCCGRWFPYRYIPVDSYLSRIVRGGRTEFQCNGRLGRRSSSALPTHTNRGALLILFPPLRRLPFPAPQARIHIPPDTGFQQFFPAGRPLGRETYRGTVSKAKQIGEKFHIIPVTYMDMNVIIH